MSAPKKAWAVHTQGNMAEVIRVWTKRSDAEDDARCVNQFYHPRRPATVHRITYTLEDAK